MTIEDYLKVIATYSYKEGIEQITEHYPKMLPDITGVIESMHAATFKTKVSQEKGARRDRLLYSPVYMNTYLSAKLAAFGWRKKRLYFTAPSTWLPTCQQIEPPGASTRIQASTVAFWPAR